MPDDKFPKPAEQAKEVVDKKSGELTQEELIERLFVCLDEGISPEILVEHIKQGNNCAFVAGKDGGIFLGINHYTMTRGSQGLAFLVDDGKVSSKRLPQYEIFHLGPWSLSSQRLANMPNAENLRNAVGLKIMKYLESIGLNTTQDLSTPK